MHHIKLLSILFGIVYGEQFWLSAEVDSIDWREGCLTTALCSQPRFQLVKDLLPISERVSVNWPISEHFVKDSVHPFVSFWPSGRLEDISLSAQVVGIDRTYGFPRICDQTPSIRMFPESHKVVKVTHHHKDHHAPSTTAEPVPHPDDSLLLNIKGKCFNATLTITKHTERCPWCPDPKDISIINQEIGTDPNALKTFGAYSIFSDERMVHLGVLILAIIAVVSSTAFAIVLVMFLRNKRMINEKNSKKPRFHPYISVKGHEMEDNNRYDMPWEQHNRPLTYWMTSSNKSDSTMTSPLDSASSLGSHPHQHHAQNPNEMYHSAYTTRDGYQTYHRPAPPMFPPPQTQLYNPRGITSPISSRNDDSGLESV